MLHLLASTHADDRARVGRGLAGTIWRGSPHSTRVVHTPCIIATRATRCNAAHAADRGNTGKLAPAQCTACVLRCNQFSTHRSHTCCTALQRGMLRCNGLYCAATAYAAFAQQRSASQSHVVPAAQGVAAVSGAERMPRGTRVVAVHEVAHIGRYAFVTACDGYAAAVCGTAAGYQPGPCC